MAVSRSVNPLSASLLPSEEVLLLRGEAAFSARGVRRDQAAAFIAGIIGAADQAIAFHSSQQLGHRRLLDPGEASQLFLCQRGAFFQGVENGHLADGKPQWLEPLLCPAEREARQAVYEMSGSSKDIFVHYCPPSR